jgi:endonuclease V-like protein UPF0215 family
MEYLRHISGFSDCKSNYETTKDITQNANNDILFNYIQAPRVKTVKNGKELFKDSEEAIKFIEQLPKKTQYEAKELKRRINDLGLKYGNMTES